MSAMKIDQKFLPNTQEQHVKSFSQSTDKSDSGMKHLSFDARDKN